MIDIKDLRERPQVYKANMKKKGRDQKLVDEVLELDKQWRAVKLRADNLRHERNRISEEINLAKKSKDEEAVKKMIGVAREIPKKLKDLMAEEADLRDSFRKQLSLIPNLMSGRVPLGDSDKDNKVEKVYGKPRKFSFPVRGHAEIAEALGMANFEDSARVAGTGFYYIESDLALLNQALIRFAIDKMLAKGFRYIETPLMLRNEVIDRVTDLNDQEVMIYRIANDDNSLIGTSEHSLIGRFVDQEINSEKMPIKHTSYSMCFRKEIGSHGIDEKGLFRTHQFNKVEMIVICMPEQSESFFEEMKKISVEIYKELGIPFRILQICSGDLGDLKYEQVDFEVYSPRRKGYIEAGSCSNLTDAQARKLGISTVIKGQRIVPHTLNNTAIATPRPLIAILENFQNKDGSVNIPKALQKYMGGKKKIEKQSSQQLRTKTTNKTHAKKTAATKRTKKHATKQAKKRAKKK